MGAKLKMKADLLAEEGGTVPTLSDTMETKEKSFLKIAAWLIFKTSRGDRASQICRICSCEVLCVSGFILIPMG